MKLLVYSDSHRDLQLMLETAKTEENPDYVIHLGDHVGDAQKLGKALDKEVIAIKGNMDGGAGKDEHLLKVKGYNLLLTHGHTYGIKGSLDRLYYRAKELECDAVLFGHTHVPMNQEIGGILFFNPGSIGDKRFQKHFSFGKIEVKEGRLEAAIVYLKESEKK